MFSTFGKMIDGLLFGALGSSPKPKPKPKLPKAYDLPDIREDVENWTNADLQLLYTSVAHIRGMLGQPNNYKPVGDISEISIEKRKESLKTYLMLKIMIGILNLRGH